MRPIVCTTLPFALPLFVVAPPMVNMLDYDDADDDDCGAVDDGDQDENLCLLSPLLLGDLSSHVRRQVSIFGSN